MAASKGVSLGSVHREAKRVQAKLRKLLKGAKAAEKKRVSGAIRMLDGVCKKVAMGCPKGSGFNPLK